MRKKLAIARKIQEVSIRIVNLEKQITEVEINRDADSINDKIFLLKRKVKLFREVLKRYATPSFDYRNVC